MTHAPAVTLGELLMPLIYLTLFAVAPTYSPMATALPTDQERSKAVTDLQVRQPVLHSIQNGMRLRPCSQQDSQQHGRG